MGMREQMPELADPQYVILLDVMDSMFVSPPNSYVESINLSVMVLGDRAFREGTGS